MDHTPEAPASSEHAHVLPLRVYLGVFLALLAGTALTTWVATLDLGRLNDGVALAIAGTKAALVILYFMHVRYSTKLIWVFVGAGFAWLAIFFVLIYADYGTRIPVPPFGG
jgi:cytochrome c oxidase subunit 4